MEYQQTLFLACFLHSCWFTVSEAHKPRGHVPAPEVGHTEQQRWMIYTGTQPCHSIQSEASVLYYMSSGIMNRTRHSVPSGFKCEKALKQKDSM